jgi:H+/Cl- antiporter ClcA
LSAIRNDLEEESTYAVSIKEMTGRGDLTVALLGASLVAMAVTTLLGSEPIYETLKRRMIEQQGGADRIIGNRAITSSE